MRSESRVPRTLLWQQQLNETTAVRKTETSGRRLDARTPDILCQNSPPMFNLSKDMRLIYLQNPSGNNQDDGHVLAEWKQLCKGQS